MRTLLPADLSGARPALRTPLSERQLFPAPGGAWKRPGQTASCLDAERYHLTGGGESRGSLFFSRRNGRKGFAGKWYAPRQVACPKDSASCLSASSVSPPSRPALGGRGEASPQRMRVEGRHSEGTEEMAEPGAGRSGAEAAAMAEGDSQGNDSVAGGEAAAASSPPPPRSPPAAVAGEGGGAKPLSAAEYARRVHQWLWDSYCGYLSWQGCLPALLAASAAPACAAGPPRVAAAPPPPPSPPPPGAAAAAYYSPFYLFAPAPAHTATAGPGPRAAAPASAAPAWPGAAGSLTPLPRAASGSAAAGTSGAPRETGRPAGEEGRAGRGSPGGEGRRGSGRPGPRQP